MALTAYALTTVDLAKAAAGVTSSSYDTLFESLVNRVSAAVSAHCNRIFLRQMYDEWYSPTPRQYLLLRQAPIWTVTSIARDGTLLVQDTDYQLFDNDLTAGMIFSEFAWPGTVLVHGVGNDPVATTRNYEVVYEAGWYLPQNAGMYVAGNPDSLPLEVSDVVEQIVFQRYLRVIGESIGADSTSEGQESTTWASDGSMQALIRQHAADLKRFVRPVIL